MTAPTASRRVIRTGSRPPPPPYGSPADQADLDRPAVDWQLPFARLDVLLSHALEEAGRRFGPEAGNDAFRGLYLTEEQVRATLVRGAGQPLRSGAAGPSPDWSVIAAAHPGWAWLRQQVGMQDAELDAVLVALAPEADLRYERLYGYLQDDVSRRRPTVDLVLDLISTTVDEKVRQRSLFAADRPLLAARVVRLAADDRPAGAPLLAHTVVLDPQITGLLLTPAGPDRELAACCRPDAPPAGTWREAALPADTRRQVLRACRAGLARGGAAPGTLLHLLGPAGSGRHAAAAALAGELGTVLLTVHCRHLPDDDEQAATAVFRAAREADLSGALLCLDGPSALPEGSRRRAMLHEKLRDRAGVTLLLDDRPWNAIGPPLGMLEVEFAGDDPVQRATMWRRELTAAGVASPGGLAVDLADRFSFGPERIAAAVAAAAAGAARAPRREQVFAAARRQTGHGLAALARRIEPARNWSDVVLPDGTGDRLRELCARVRLRSTVLEDWGLGRTLVRGRGVSALFTGPPGTGKTTAAEVVARELGLDLYAIDLSAVVSKYIGETEKNLERIFSAAAEADAILMFDEADALFGKRSQVRDAHDRYANIETSYLLQRMEAYQGVAILATNLRDNLDEAFTRRLQFIIDFPFPDERLRAGIWSVVLGSELPMAPDVDPIGLGRDHRLSGAGITNAALHAAYLAAARGGRVDAATLHEAVRHEFRKMGRVPPGRIPEGPATQESATPAEGRG